MQTVDKPAPESGGFTPLGSRSEVALTAPLPHYDAMGGPAYLARMKGASTADLMAIICRSGYPPRSDIVNQLRNIDNPAILRFVDSGMVDFTPDGQRYYGFVFEQPQNPRLWQTLDENRQPLGEDFINRRFIAPVAAGLRQLADVGLMHGGIRPTNIFWRENTTSLPQLGECMSVAPGIGQPLLFEPLDRAQALPYARGPGTMIDDMYALGVTIVCLIMGRHPLKGLDDQTILRMRLERGSFVTLIDNYKLAPGHVELLRGLLQDDHKQRWNAYDLEQWIGGQRLSPKQSEFSKRSTRALIFKGHEYWQVRPLIPALWANVTEGAKLIESGEIDRWLRRSMADDDRADRARNAVMTLKSSGRTNNYDEQLVTMTAIALDPNGLIGYRGQVMMTQGIGGALAEALRANANVQIIAEVISNQFVGFWVNQQTEGKIDLVPIAQNFERMRVHAERGVYGSGIERIVYELNPTLACLSPLLKGQNVIAAKDFLNAMERAASQPGRPAEPYDRHIIAWLATKDRGMEYVMRSLNSTGNTLHRALAILNLYNDWQQKYGPDQTPALAAWLGAMLEPLARRYFNRPTRDAVAAALQAATATGRLSELVRLLDDQSLLERDQQSFIAARQIYRATLRQIAALEHQQKYRDEVARTYGRPTATYIAWVIAAMAIIFTIMNVLTG